MNIPNITFLFTSPKIDSKNQIWWLISEILHGMIHFDEEELSYNIYDKIVLPRQINIII
jgi:hypothetical protein